MKGSTSLDPSEWISGLLQTCVADGATAFDLACGSGRHSVLCRDLKFKVTAFDRNSDLKVNFENLGISFECVDLESGVWPLTGKKADLVIVSNYLYRPRLLEIFSLVANDGFLIYETFGIGNQRYGKPSNPDYLLEPGELVELLPSGFKILDEFFGETINPSPAIRARLFARRDGSL